MSENTLNAIKRVVVIFTDESGIEFAINPRHWDMNVEHDISSKGGSSGFVEHVGLPSGKVMIQANYLEFTYIAKVRDEEIV